MAESNLELLRLAAARLEPLLDEIVFVGGATVGLLITDSAAAPLRTTLDVDVIAAVATYGDYIEFSERLRAQGFTEDVREDAVICRWRCSDLTLDVMPIDPSVLGFSNRWYAEAFLHAAPVDLPGRASIHVITAPYLLGTKMEAFRGRGNDDYLASQDLEDFVAVIDGRPSIVEEIQNSESQLRGYLVHAAQTLLSEPRFRDVLPGYVLDEGRAPLILNRLRAIAAV